MQFHTASWNVQGKSLQDFWDKLSLDGINCIGLQDLGGLKDQHEPWKLHHIKLDSAWSFFTSRPEKVHHAVAIGLPAAMLPFVVEVRLFAVGMGILVHKDSAKRFFVTAHLPHGQREDCVDMWLQFQQELDTFLHRRRLHDSLIICMDANYEL